MIVERRDHCLVLCLLKNAFVFIPRHAHFVVFVEYGCMTFRPEAFDVKFNPHFSNLVCTTLVRLCTGF